MRCMRPKLYGRRHPCHPGSRLRIIYHPDLDQGQGGRQLQQFRMLIDSFLDARCWMLDTGQRSARRPTLLYLLRVAGSSNVEFGHLSSVFGHLSSVLCLPSSVLCFLSSAIRHLSSVFCPLPSVICPQSSDNLSQAALALAVFLSPPDSTFPVEDGGAPRKRAIRSSRGGWVENKLIKLRPDNGLTINM